jgi:aspartyl/glutamyl-tRNA(Asn/Gln) amidotransferase C subunit
MDKPVIERDEVQRLSRLAHLELDEGELEAMVVELGAIVAYVNTLEAVDVEGVAVPRHFGLQRLAL